MMTCVKMLQGVWTQAQKYTRKEGRHISVDFVKGFFLYLSEITHTIVASLIEVFSTL